MEKMGRAGMASLRLRVQRLKNEHLIKLIIHLMTGRVFLLTTLPRKSYIAVSSPTMSSSLSSLASLKPFDRVMAWLDSNIPVGQRRSGAKIPATREVSRQLNVSQGTVQKVYQHLAERGLIQTEIGSGTFWTSAAEAVGASEEAANVLKIGINVGLPGEHGPQEGWGYRIFGGMFNAILSSSRSLLLQPVSLFDEQGEVKSDSLPLLDDLSGFISFPTPSSTERLDALLRERRIAHITLNPLTPSSTSRFVAPDYMAASRRISAAFARAGRRKLLLLLSPGKEQSVSCQLRFSGFALGLHLEGRQADFQTVVVPVGTVENGTRVFNEQVAKGWIPDAVYAAGDHLAKGVLDAALAHGLSVPADLSIVGGNGTLKPAPHDPYYITSMAQPLEAIGERLIQNVVSAIYSPNLNLPGEIIPSSFTIGTTTLAEENCHLAP